VLSSLNLMVIPSFFGPLSISLSPSTENIYIYFFTSQLMTNAPCMALFKWIYTYKE
jgi:hypothetical protein